MVETGLPPMQDEVENRSIQDGWNGERLAGCRRSRQDENAGADDRANTESRQAPRPEGLVQPLSRLFRVRNKSIDALGAEQAHAA